MQMLFSYFKHQSIAKLSVLNNRLSADTTYILIIFGPESDSLETCQPADSLLFFPAEKHCKAPAPDVSVRDGNDNLSFYIIPSRLP